MSSILNALRKLEEEQRPVDEGPLREDVALAPGRSPAFAPWAAALVGGLAVVLVSALLVRSFWGTGATVPDPAPTSEPQWADPDSADRTLAAGGLAERRLAARRTEPHAPLSPSTRGVDEAPVERAARSRSSVPPPPAEGTVASRRRPEPVVPSAPPTARSAPSPPPRPDPPSPAPRRAAPAPKPQPVQAAVAPPAPPVEVAAPKPAPMQVAQIAWHPDSERRRAWLRVDGEEGRREVREGDKVGNYTVVRIEPSSVLFQSGDIELRQPLGGKS